MAPRKAKSQGKRNNIKIKSKLTTQKRGPKPVKKNASGEKPLQNLKWLNNLPVCRPTKNYGGNWLGIYKHGTASSSGMNSNEYVDYPQKDGEEKSTISYVSEECNCYYPKYSENTYGILKRKFSSRDRLVAKYIKSGMDHVASFIVESAIRFGKEHGVVVPDKNSPNIYEITSPDNRMNEKYRKIRFRIPNKELGYEDAKKAMWRSHLKNVSMCQREESPADQRSNVASNPSSWESTPDSLENILPLLEKLEQEGGGIVNSDLDLEKLKRTSETDDIGRNRGRERYREEDTDRFRSKGKRYKSAGSSMDKGSQERNFSTPRKGAWKMFKRDSLELGRQRLRASTCPRKPSPSY